jgi:hypothetical protein
LNLRDHNANARLAIPLRKQTEYLPEGTPVRAVITDRRRGRPHLRGATYANDCDAGKT